MKKFSITALSLLLMLLFVSCSDDDSFDDGGDDNNETNSYIPNTGTVLNFESYELDENNNETGNPEKSEQTIIGKMTILGEEATAIEDYSEETGIRDTIYIREDDDFMYLYMSEDYFDIGGGSGFIPSIDMEPQWVKICSFTQFNWTAFEHKIEGLELDIPFGGIDVAIELSVEILWEGKKETGNSNFTIRDKNETLETILNEISMKFIFDGKPVGIPIQLPMFPMEQVSISNFSIAKGFGIVQTLQQSQEADPEDPISQPMPGNISKMVDYTK